MDGEPNKQKADIYLQMAIGQGYVPQTCVLDGQLVMLLVIKHEDPCAGCNADRTICKGRPKR